MFHCKYCVKKFLSPHILIGHMRRCTLFFNNHLNNQVACGQPNCSRHFSSLLSLRTHLLRHHSSDLKNERNIPSEHIDDNNMAIDDSLGETMNNVDETQSLFDNILCSYFASLYSKPEIPRNYVQFLAEELESFLFFYNNLLGTNTSEQKVLHLIDSLTKSLSLFNSEYKRFMYFQNRGSLIFPKEIPVGTREEYRRGTLTQSRSVIQVVPINEVLQQILSMGTILQESLEYMASCRSRERPLINVVQGSVWRNMEKKILKEDRESIHLPIILYYDDFESNCPIGTHNVIQKMGGVYLSLPFLPKHYFSKLNSVLLLALFHSSDRTALGNKRMFEKVIEDLNILSDNGILLNVYGLPRRVKFHVVCITGDNLGLNGILGFVESFNSMFSCRICSVDKNNMQSMLYEQPGLLRTEKSYSVDLALNDYSKTGIKEQCVWFKLRHFDLFRNVAVDVLHDFMEGVCRYVMKFVCKYLIQDKKLIGFRTLEHRIVSFDYGPDNSSKPVNAITMQGSTLLLRTSASEMTTLVRYFGLIAGPFVPEADPVWELYILLRKLLARFLSHRVYVDSLGQLSEEIALLNDLYMQLSKQNLKPKFHLLVHYPHFFRAFGPLSNVWTFRFEAKHRVFKVAARATSNKLNISKTIALRNQLTLNQILIGGFTSKQCETGKLVGVESMVEIPPSIPRSFLDTHFSTSFVKMSGIHFSKGSIILLSIDSNSDLPQFAVVKNIFVPEKGGTECFFFCYLLSTVDFDFHLFAYEVTSSSETILIKYKDLYSPQLTHTLTHDNDKHYVTMRITID
jgi:hypothetical protein